MHPWLHGQVEGTSANTLAVFLGRSPRLGIALRAIAGLVFAGRTTAKIGYDDTLMCPSAHEEAYANGRYLAGAVTPTPPVGTIASAVLVAFTDCELVSASAAVLTKRSCTGLAVSAATAAAAISAC